MSRPADHVWQILTDINAQTVNVDGLDELKTTCRQLIQSKPSSEETLKILDAARTQFEQKAGRVQMHTGRCDPYAGYSQEQPKDNVNFVKQKVINLLQYAVLEVRKMRTEVRMFNPYCV
jgi:hypothetical protein